MRSAKFNVSIQDMPYAKEEKIQRDIFNLESKRSSLFQRKDGDYLSNVKHVEVELCYLHRELEIRKRRKLAHAAFMEKKMKNRPNNRSHYRSNNNRGNRTNSRDNRAKR